MSRRIGQVMHMPQKSVDQRSQCTAPTRGKVPLNIGHIQPGVVDRVLRPLYPDFQRGIRLMIGDIITNNIAERVYSPLVVTLFKARANVAVEWKLSIGALCHP